jgi:hypothetical protein
MIFCISFVPAAAAAAADAAPVIQPSTVAAAAAAALCTGTVGDQNAVAKNPPDKLPQ